MSLFTGLKALSTTSKLIKGAKGAFTIIEVLDVVLDAAQLGDEIARAIMGDNYSPELRDLAQEVADAGIVYDEKLAAIAKANVDISNLYAGINSLKEIELDYGERQALVQKHLKKLDDLKNLLSATSPTTYQWFSTLGNRAELELKDTSDTDRLNALKSVVDPSFLNIGLLTGMLGFRAASFGYSRHKKNKAQNNEVRNSSNERRSRSKAFLEGSPEAKKHRLAADAAIHNRRKARAKTAGKAILKGVDKLVTVGSFGMNIYTLINKVNQVQEAIRELRKMLARYKEETRYYEQALNGVPDDENALNAFASFFELGDISAESTRESLRAGYYATVRDYEETVVTLLERPDDASTEEDESSGINYAYLSMIQAFENTKLEDSDNAVINALQSSYSKFNNLKVTALDTSKPSEVRKVEGLDPIRDEFIDSVSNELNNILLTLSIQIADHSSLNMLMSRAESLLEDAAFDAEAERRIQRATLEEIGLAGEQLEQAVERLVENARQRAIAQSAAVLDREAERMLRLLNKDTFFPERSKFKREADVRAALEESMRNLSAQATQPALAVPLENLQWSIEGPGTTGAKADDATSSITYDYSLSGPSVWRRQTWTYQAEAPTTGPVSLDWIYSGFHAWYRPYVQIRAFADGQAGRQYNPLLEGSRREASGNLTLQLSEGQPFGFVIAGSNYDRDSRLLGTLKVDFEAPAT